MDSLTSQVQHGQSLGGNWWLAGRRRFGCGGRRLRIKTQAEERGPLINTCHPVFEPPPPAVVGIGFACGRVGRRLDCGGGRFGGSGWLDCGGG